MNEEGNIKILIVDDINLNRQYLAMVLSTLTGIEIVGEAANGKDAIDNFGNLAPDIMFMDVQLPVMDGIQATSQITKLFPNTVVIALSTDTDKNVIKAMKNAGAAVGQLAVNFHTGQPRQGSATCMGP